MAVEACMGMRDVALVVGIVFAVACNGSSNALDASFAAPQAGGTAVDRAGAVAAGGAGPGSAGATTGAAGSAGMQVVAAGAGGHGTAVPAGGGGGVGGALLQAGARASAGSGGTGGDAAGAAGGGGAAGSSGAGKVDLPGGVIALFPPPGGTDVCADPALRLSFSGAPRLGNAGNIQVRDLSSGSAVATVDLGATRWNDTIGGVAFNLTTPIEVDGATIAIRLPSKGLGYGKRFEVIVDRGAITGPTGAVEIGAGTWTFATRAAAAPAGTEVTVAADGGADFCSVQGAIDALPGDAAAQRVIRIARGTYRGIVHFARRNKLTLRGEDRKGTVLCGINNDALNPGTAKRALIGIDESQDLKIENLTIHNQTPQGGSQAEALRIQRCERCSVIDADIKSLQDTLLWSGRVYARGCYIEGNVDYIWGTGTAFFDSCEIKTVGRAGYLVQARNGPGAYGYVFVDTKLTSDPGVTGDVLARIDASEYPGSHVAYIDCVIGPHVSAAGWTITGGAATSALRFWEYGSKTPSGAPVDTSRRTAGSRQLSAAEAAMMRDPAVVLGGWQPR